MVCGVVCDARLFEGLVRVVLVVALDLLQHILLVVALVKHLKILILFAKSSPARGPQARPVEFWDSIDLETNSAAHPSQRTRNTEPCAPLPSFFTTLKFSMSAARALVAEAKIHLRRCHISSSAQQGWLARFARALCTHAHARFAPPRLRDNKCAGVGVRQLLTGQARVPDSGLDVTFLPSTAAAPRHARARSDSTSHITFTYHTHAGV